MEVHRSDPPLKFISFYARDGDKIKCLEQSSKQDLWVSGSHLLINGILSSFVISIVQNLDISTTFGCLIWFLNERGMLTVLWLLHLQW